MTFKTNAPRYAQWFILVSGFAFGLAGGLWTLIFVDRGDAALKRLNDYKSSLAHQIESINGAAASYYLANQQGDMLYLLDQQANVHHDIAALMLRGNLLDRSTPVRNMIGALALARQVSFPATYAEYEKLNDSARADLTYEKYTLVKNHEAAIVEQGFRLVPLMLEEQGKTIRSIEAEEAATRRNRVLGVAASTFGSFLLLLANLIEKRKIIAPAEPEVTL